MWFVILLLLSSISIAQDLGEWFPKGLNVQPFTANFLEPAAGFSYILGKQGLQLDIGTSEDLYHYRCGTGVYSFGADFYTYTRLRGESDFHFPVETIDYMFGLNAAYKRVERSGEYGIRFRLSHISAHLVDGQFDRNTGWRDGRFPQVYSREFVELFPYYRWEGIRAYLGLTYLFHANPEEVGKGIYQAGFDYYAAGLLNNISPFLAYDFKLSKINNYVGNNTIVAGVKFGNYQEKGIRLYYKYISGMSVHGEYYDLYESYSSLGVNLDF